MIEPEPFLDAHDGTDLPYHLSVAAAAMAHTAGVSTDEALAAANDPDSTHRARQDGSRAVHLRGDVHVVVDTTQGLIVKVGKVVWVEPCHALAS